MAITINWPSNPSVNDVYTLGSKSWMWNGTGWLLQPPIRPYGGLYLSGGSTTQTTNATGGVFDTVTGWSSNGYFDNMTVDHTANTITTTLAGTYYVGVNVSFSGSSLETYVLRLFNVTQNVASPNCYLERKLGTGGDVGSASFQGFIFATANDVFVVQVAAIGSSKAFTPSYANWTMHYTGA